MKTNYHVDKFIDNNGIEREFILAAVSLDLRNSKDVEFVSDSYTTIHYHGGDWSDYNMEKVLCLGIAVRRPEDKFDKELGMKIAQGKALKSLTNPSKGKQVFVSDAGLINTKMVEALLEQEALYFKRDPRCYISGYGKANKK